MLRGDDIYLLDWWPLDNLNTMGAGVGYTNPVGLTFMLHGGLSQPDTPFYTQTVERPAPLNQFGSMPVEILDRQRFIGSLRAEYAHKLGEKAGIKGVLYGELHELPSAQRETEIPRTFESLPADDGFDDDDGCPEPDEDDDGTPDAFAGACLASCGWVDEPDGGTARAYVTLLHPAALFATYISVRDDGLPVAQSIPSNAGLPPGHMLPRVTAGESDRTYDWCAVYRAQLPVDDGVTTDDVFAEAGPRQIGRAHV
mgnify:CR=1 FL=1